MGAAWPLTGKEMPAMPGKLDLRKVSQQRKEEALKACGNQVSLLPAQAMLQVARGPGKRQPVQ